MTRDLPDTTTTLAIDLANLASSYRSLTAALTGSDLAEHAELRAWTTAVNTLLGTLTEQVTDLHEQLHPAGTAPPAGES